MSKKTGKKFNIKDIGKPSESMTEISADDIMPVPGIDEIKDPVIAQLTEKQKADYEHSLDGVSALSLPKPKSKEEEQKLVESFLNGLKKLLSKENNWTFLQPLLLSLENCTRCLNCSDS